MTNLQAAIGCAQLEQIDRLHRRKREMAARYDEGLAGLPLQLPHVEAWARSSVWMYAVVLDGWRSLRRGRIRATVGGRGRPDPAVFHGHARAAGLPGWDFFGGSSFPVTEKIYRRGLYLPSGQAITDEQIRETIAAARAVLSFEVASAVNGR